MNHYKRLKDIREDHDLEQAEIAKILETTQQQISKYENGRQMMGIDKYIKLSEYYNVSIDYLAGVIDTPKPLKETKKVLTAKQLALLEAYEKNKEMQNAVDKLLEI